MPDPDPRVVRPLASIRDALGLLLRCKLPLVLWELGAGVVLAIVLAPLLAWVFYGLLSWSGSGAIVNFDLASFFLSVKGLGILVLYAVAVSMLAVLLLGGPVLLTSAARVQRRVDVFAVTRRVLSAWSRIPGRGALLFALLAALLAPLVVALVGAVGTLVLVPFGGEPPKAILPAGAGGIPAVAAAFLVVAAVGLWLHARWFLAVHVLTLEDASLTAAMKESARLVRGRTRPMLMSLGAWYLLQALALGAVALLLGLAGRGILGWIDLSGRAAVWIVALMLVVQAVVLGLLALVGQVGLVALGTNLYARLAAGAEARMIAAADALEIRRRGVLAGHPWRVAGIALLLFAGAAALAVPEVIEEMDTFHEPPLVTAHRGSSAEAPENTLAAFRLAIEDGADTSELDVFQAGDGTLVVTHDKNLKRVAGVDRNVWEVDGEELAGLEAGSHFDERFRGEPFPTLEQVIETVKGRMRLNIELKTHGHEKGFARAVVETVRRLDFADQCVITSLDEAILEDVRAVDPGIRIGMIITAMIGKESALDVDFYSVEQAKATVDFIKRAHRDGREVHVWTVNERAQMQELVARGADNLITDHPRLAREVIDGRSPGDEMGDALRRLFRP